VGLIQQPGQLTGQQHIYTTQQGMVNTAAAAVAAAAACLFPFADMTAVTLQSLITI